MIGCYFVSEANKPSAGASWQRPAIGRPISASLIDIGSHIWHYSNAKYIFCFGKQLQTGPGGVKQRQRGPMAPNSAKQCDTRPNRANLEYKEPTRANWGQPEPSGTKWAL